MVVTSGSFLYGIGAGSSPPSSLTGALVGTGEYRLRRTKCLDPVFLLALPSQVAFMA